jgi:hypothetical protein
LSTTNTIDALNQLLAILGRSFPQYLRFAHPYISPGHERTAEIFEEITSDQNELIERISQEIYDSGELPDLGKFPAEFTNSHDLNIDYLARESIHLVEQDVARLTNCAESLHLAPAAKTLAEEAVGMTQGHLESLKEIAHGV